MHLNPDQLQQLKTEITTDPKSLGYAPLMAVRNFQGTADKLNAFLVATDTVAREPMETQDVIENIVAADFNSMTTANATKLQVLLSTAQVRIASNAVQSLFSTLFGVNSATMTAFTALKTRRASRAEILFGAGS